MEAFSEKGWTIPTQHPALGTQDVHIWRFRVDGSDMTSARALLTVDEIARAERLRVERKRVQYIHARASLRSILARYLDTAPATLRFDYGPQGKPALAAPHADADIQFNLSHAGAWGILGITRLGPIGVDIEATRPMREDVQLAERFFSPREAEGLRALPESERCAAFFQCWTCKEGYLKARGDGLRFPLDAFEVALPPAAPALLAVRDAPEEAAAWTLQILQVAPGYAAACALRAIQPEFDYFSAHSEGA